MEDGDEIFVCFLNTHQHAGKKASDYLQRLQTILKAAVRRDGVKYFSANLLKQFQCVCWNQSLILTLQLESKAKTSLDFAELLSLLKTEESRWANKLDRKQHHIGSPKQKVSSHTRVITDVSAYTDPRVLKACLSETEALRKQVADLKMQLVSSKPRKGNHMSPSWQQAHLMCLLEQSVQSITRKTLKTVVLLPMWRRWSHH